MYGNCHIIKYSAATVIVSIVQEQEHGAGVVVKDFVSWCQHSFLYLYVKKTKDMVIDAGR